MRPLLDSLPDVTTSTLVAGMSTVAANTVIDFTIVAFCVFMIIKVMNSLKKKPAPAASAAPLELTKQEKLLVEIRDILSKPVLEPLVSPVRAAAGGRSG